MIISWGRRVKVKRLNQGAYGLTDPVDKVSVA